MFSSLLWPFGLNKQRETQYAECERCQCTYNKAVRMQSGTDDGLCSPCSNTKMLEQKNVELARKIYQQKKPHYRYNWKTGKPELVN